MRGAVISVVEKNVVQHPETVHISARNQQIFHCCTRRHGPQSPELWAYSSMLLIPLTPSDTAHSSRDWGPCRGVQQWIYFFRVKMRRVFFDHRYHSPPRPEDERANAHIPSTRCMRSTDITKHMSIGLFHSHRKVDYRYFFRFGVFLSLIRKSVFCFFSFVWQVPFASHA